MATMQAARKRDAETAFAGSNGKYQDHDWESEEQEASQQESTQTSTTGNQQMLVDNILREFLDSNGENCVLVLTACCHLHQHTFHRSIQKGNEKARQQSLG